MVAIWLLAIGVAGVGPSVFEIFLQHNCAGEFQSTGCGMPACCGSPRTGVGWECREMGLVMEPLKSSRAGCYSVRRIEAWRYRFPELDIIWQWLGLKAARKNWRWWTLQPESEFTLPFRRPTFSQTQPVAFSQSRDSGKVNFRSLKPLPSKHRQRLWLQAYATQLTIGPQGQRGLYTFRPCVYRPTTDSWSCSASTAKSRCSTHEQNRF